MGLAPALFVLRRRCQFAQKRPNIKRCFHSILKNEEDCFTVRFGIRVSGETWRLKVSQIQIAYKTTEQHPEQNFFRRANRIVLYYALTFLIYPIADASKFGLAYLCHTFSSYIK